MGSSGMCLSCSTPLHPLSHHCPWSWWGFIAMNNSILVVLGILREFCCTSPKPGSPVSNVATNVYSNEKVFSWLPVWAAGLFTRLKYVVWLLKLWHMCWLAALTGLGLSCLGGIMCCMLCFNDATRCLWTREQVCACDVYTSTWPIICSDGKVL